MFMFSIYDSKSETFDRPFFSTNTATALREFTHVARNPSSTINQFATDYTLFELGEFNQSTAEFTAHPSPKALTLATAVILHEDDNE